MEEKTSLGLAANIEAAITNLLAPTIISSIIILVLEKESKFVRFYAMQSLVVFLFLWLANLIFSFIPVVGGMVCGIISLVNFVAWVYFIYMGYKGKKFKVPTCCH